MKIDFALVPADLLDLINRFWTVSGRKIKLLNTNYDPASDSYHFDYSLFIGMIIGALIIILIVIFLVKEYRYLKRANQT